MLPHQLVHSMKTLVSTKQCWEVLTGIQIFYVVYYTVCVTCVEVLVHIDRRILTGLNDCKTDLLPSENNDWLSCEINAQDNIRTRERYWREMKKIAECKQGVQDWRQRSERVAMEWQIPFLIAGTTIPHNLRVFLVPKPSGERKQADLPRTSSPLTR